MGLLPHLGHATPRKVGGLLFDTTDTAPGGMVVTRVTSTLLTVTVTVTVTKERSGNPGPSLPSRVEAHPPL